MRRKELMSVRVEYQEAGEAGEGRKYGSRVRGMPQGGNCHGAKACVSRAAEAGRWWG